MIFKKKFVTPSHLQPPKKKEEKKKKKGFGLREKNSDDRKIVNQPIFWFILALAVFILHSM